MVLYLRQGQERDRDEIIHKLIDIQYDRNDMDFTAVRFVSGAMCWRFFRQMRMSMRIG